MCRNEHRAYQVGKNKVAVKKFKNSKSSSREIKFYNFFAENPLALTPKVHYMDENFLITDFINNTGQNLELTIVDWANIHSETINSEITGFERFYIEKEIEAIIKPNCISPKIKEQLSRKLSKPLKKEMLSLTHGDLYFANILNDGSNNYYIDFESGGRAHPCRDLSLLLFNHPNMQEEIIETYKSTIKFYYDNIDADIEKFHLIKLCQILIGLNRDSHLPSNYKTEFTNKAEKQIKAIINN